MAPVKTDSTNRMYRPPKDAEKDCIEDLPVTIDVNGVQHSFWQPTEVDIANILAGVPVRLSIMSKGHPPVALAVTDKV